MTTVYFRYSINIMILNSKRNAVILVLALIGFYFTVPETFANSPTSSMATLFIGGLPDETDIIINKSAHGKTDGNGTIEIPLTQGWYQLRAEKSGEEEENWTSYTEKSFYIYAGEILNLQLKLTHKEPSIDTLHDLLDSYMVSIPGGTFIMGRDPVVYNASSRDVDLKDPNTWLIPLYDPEDRSKEYLHEQPAHLVNIKQFRMGSTEVTFELYDLYREATGQDKVSDRGWGRERQPVPYVDKEDAVRFIRWLNKKLEPEQPYRLPSEAEWEYAARGGTTSLYWWGDDVGINNANCSGCGSNMDNESPSPVASFKPNPFGLYDTSGNVQEWVADCWHNSYRGAPSSGKAWGGGIYGTRNRCTSSDLGNHVLRGGSFASSTDEVTNTHRFRFNMNQWIQDREATGGLRLAQDETIDTIN